MGAVVDRGVVESPDGVLTTFSLTEQAVAGSMQPHLQGVSVPRADFSETTSASFTLMTAPRAGDQLRVFFEPLNPVAGAGVFGVPIGPIDGVNRIFSTPTVPYQPGEVRIQVNGVTQPPDAVTEIDPALGTFQVDTDFAPDPLRDELIVYYLDPSGGSGGGPVVVGPIHVTVSSPDVVEVTVDQPEGFINVIVSTDDLC